MTFQQSAPYRLTLLGPWDLRGPDGEKVRSVLSQPKRLCLLAYLALADGPVARSTLVALFWPESDEERARNALSQSLHYLRRSLGPGVVESVEGDRIRVAPERVWVDARELLRVGNASGRAGAGPATGVGEADGLDGDALGGFGGDVVEAARRIGEGREFFQGYNADDNQPLQEWLDETRRAVRRRAEEVLAAVGGAGPGAVGVPPGESSTREAPQVVAPRAGATLEVDTRRDGPGATDDRRGRRTIRRWVLAGGGSLLVIVSGLLALQGEGSSTPAAVVDTEPPEVAVLLPRVTVLADDPSYSADALAQAVHDELAVLLGRADHLRTVFISFESEVWRLVRSLEAQGTDRVPDWILTIGIRSAEGQARVVGLLLRGPDYTEARVVHAQSYRVEPGPDVLMDLPRRIAEAVAEGVANGFPPGGAPGRPETGPGVR